MTTRLVMPDAELAAFASPAWVERVASVPIEEVPEMVCEDPSVVHSLIGALRHARARIVELESAHHSTWKAKHDVLWRALERGREQVERGRSLFTPAPDGTTADFKLGLSILLDHMETALAVPTDG